MKTAISLPDPLFRKAEEAARRLGVSRSQLFATALASYLESRRPEAITEALDRVYQKEESGVEPVLAELQRASLPDDRW